MLMKMGKMNYRETVGMVIYRSRMYVSLKWNFQLMSGAAWLRLLLDHVPDKGEANSCPSISY